MKTDFTRIYHLIKNDILRLAFSYVRSISDAEDITQSLNYMKILMIMKILNI